MAWIQRIHFRRIYRLPQTADAPVTVNAQQATLTLSGVTSGATLGALTVDGQQGTVVLSGVPGSIVGAPVTVTAQIATLTLSAVTSQPTLTALTVPAQQGTVVLSGVTSGATLTALTVTAQVATLTLTGVANLTWPYIDPFTYSNQDLDDANPARWETITGNIDGWGPANGPLVVSSSQVTLGAAGEMNLMNSPAASGFPFDDQYAEVDYNPNGATTFWGAGVGVRTTGTDGPTIEGYHAWAFLFAGDLILRLDRVDDGVATPIDQAVLADANPHRLAIEAIGNEIKGYLDGVEVLSATDSAYPTARGYFLGAYSSAGLPLLDNWEAGEAGEVAVTVTAQVATLTLSGVTSGGTLAALTVNAQQGTVVLSGVPGTPANEGDPVTVTAQVATLTLSGVTTQPTLAPLTVTANVGPSLLYLEPLTGTATTPDPGDPADSGFVIVARVRGPGTTGGPNHTIASQYESAVTRAWLYRRNETNGQLVWTESPDGTTAAAVSRTITTPSVAPTANDEYWALAVTVNSGGNQLLRASRSTDGGVTWTPGTQQSAATVGIFDTTSLLRIGAFTSTDVFDGRIYWVEMRTGTDPAAGSVVWRFDAADYPGSGTSYVDPRGRTWTLTAAGALVVAADAIHLTGVSGTVTLAPITVTAQTATLTLTGQPGQVAGGPVTVVAQTATLQLSAVAGTATPAGLTVTAQPATLALTAQAGTVTLAALTVAAQIAVLVLSAVSSGGDAFTEVDARPRIVSRQPGRIISYADGRILSRDRAVIESGV